MTDLDQIAQGGVLRAAINTGNRALVQQEGGALTGVSPDLARRLSAALGVLLQPVIYEGAGKVFANAGNDRWDVAFMAIDQMRAEQVSFTRPYHTIEATFAVRAGSDLRHVTDVDRAGTQVLTATGSAYDMYLTKTLKQASLERSGTPPESFDAFRQGQCDVVAGVRASLEATFGMDPAVRILPGVLTKVEQAMVLPGQNNPAIIALDAFVAQALACGFVAERLA